MKRDSVPVPRPGPRGRGAERGAVTATLLILLLAVGSAAALRSDAVAASRRAALAAEAVHEHAVERARCRAAHDREPRGALVVEAAARVRIAPRFRRMLDHAWPPPRAPGVRTG